MLAHAVRNTAPAYELENVDLEAQKFPLSEDEAIANTAKTVLKNIVPPTGAASRSKKIGVCPIGCAVVAGVVFISAFATAAVWGTGTGLWVEGSKQDNQGLVTAGKITTFVGIGLFGATCLIATCSVVCTGLIGKLK